MAVSRRLRFEVLRRDGHTCRYCGAKSPDVALTVDHVKPVALGGKDEPANLVTACANCNAGKASIAPDSPIVAQVEQDALRWASAMQRAVYFRSIDLQVLADQVARFDTAWLAWRVDEGRGDPLWRQSDWPDSVERFLQLGLSPEVLERCIGIAMRSPKLRRDEVWAYFCGCAWRELDRLQEITHNIVQAEEEMS